MKKMLILALVFCAGMLSEKMLVGNSAAPRRPDLAAAAIAATCTDAKLSFARQTAKFLPESQIPREPSGTATLRSRSLVVEHPRNDRPVLTSEQEDRLSKFVDAVPPALEKSSQKHFPDGSTDVFGKTEDGADVYQHFNPAGELAKENWNYPSGEALYRSFYSSGGIKTLSWNRADQGSTSINFGEAGLYETRYDKAPEGSSTSTTYDDSGQIKEVWHAGPDGKYVKVD